MTHTQRNRLWTQQLIEAEVKRLQASIDEAREMAARLAEQAYVMEREKNYFERELDYLNREAA